MFNIFDLHSGSTLRSAFFLLQNGHGFPRTFGIIAKATFSLDHQLFIHTCIRTQVVFEIVSIPMYRKSHYYHRASVATPISSMHWTQKKVNAGRQDSKIVFVLDVSFHACCKLYKHLLLEHK